MDSRLVKRRHPNQHADLPIPIAGVPLPLDIDDAAAIVPVAISLIATLASISHPS
jgi:hypothetical protein